MIHFFVTEKAKEILKSKESQEGLKSSDSEPTQPPKKRSRVLNFQESDSDEGKDAETEAGGTEGEDLEKYRGKIPALKSMFPHLEDQVSLR